jgi:hypothetical protein
LERVHRQNRSGQASECNGSGSAVNTATTRSADQLEDCSDRECTGDPVNPDSKQRTLDVLRWGLIPYWAKDPKIAYKTITWRVENGRYGAIVAPSLQKTTLSDSGKRILRVEVEDPLFHRDGRQFSVCICRSLGGLVARKRLHFSTPFTNNYRNSQQNTPEEYH